MEELLKNQFSSFAKSVIWHIVYYINNEKFILICVVFMTFRTHWITFLVIICG